MTAANQAHEIAMQALRIIAGREQCIDNLMSNVEIAQDALRLIEELTATQSQTHETTDVRPPQYRNHARHRR